MDNWLSVFHFIVFGDDWQVQQYDCCPFNELLFPFCFHYLPDIHHCFWFLWAFLVHFNVRKKTNFVFERRWEDGRVQIHWQWNSLFSWVTNRDGLMCLCVWQPWTLSHCLMQLVRWESGVCEWMAVFHNKADFWVLTIVPSKFCEWWIWCKWDMRFLSKM